MRKFTTAVAGAILATSLSGISAQAQANRSVQIILDASGSMIKRLPRGDRKLTAAKEAMNAFIGTLPPGTRLSLRAYGHQSRQSLKDCRDTEQIVDFEPAPAVAQTVSRNIRRLRPRGYSPISLSLQKAAEDLGDEPVDLRKMIVLVSDGRETCDGDPCAMARQLNQRYPNLAIHTVGFSVRQNAREQLQCIARVAGGKYFDAKTPTDLTTQLGAAYAVLPAMTRKVIVVANPEPGSIEIENPADRHLIKNVETNEMITAIGEGRPSAQVPPGIYNVTFGNGTWKSVEVTSGEKTVLRPGQLKIRNASILGHEIFDPDTDEVIARVTPRDDAMPLVPDTVYVKFGNAIWTDVEIKQGETTVLNPGVIRVQGASLRGVRMREYSVISADGDTVGKLSLANPKIPLPPGRYTVDVLGQRIPVSLNAGQIVDLKVQ